MIVFCWTHPRSHSTALEKCMSRVVKTLHEPFSASYCIREGWLSESETAGHSATFAGAAQRVLDAERRYGVVFVKEHAYYVLRQRGELDKYLESLFLRCRHVYLVRPPHQAVPSLAEQMQRAYGGLCTPELVDRSVGIADLRDLLARFASCGVSAMHRVDAQRLVDNPAAEVHALCQAIGLPFDPEKLLSWEAGALEDWKIWSDKGWHDDVEQSTAFTKDLVHSYNVPPFVDAIIQENLPIYKDLIGENFVGTSPNILVTD